ncbi:hypothetical protein LJR219_004377 [Phenylobacterium sp. LjRoot219]|uniref:hypothetical protein n=1 Tax=Phenylobacterium sp. LjRoot219 TaxID=3342283 RepID=UPI003ECD3073
MDAPNYAPATAYHQPSPATFELGVDTLSIEDLISSTATRAILTRLAPWALGMAGTETFKPFLSTFTLRDAAHYLPFDATKPIAEVDAALRALPKSEWPPHVR